MKNTRGAPPRIQDVALLAGVSKTAVSFAFNRPERLKPTTRDRILSAAAELGYRPSPIARRLARSRTDQIGLVLPQPTHDVFANPFLPELLRGIGDVCDSEGIALVIVPPLSGSLARAVEAALVDGIVLLGLAPNHPDLELARRSGLSVVAIDVEAPADVDVIAIDDAGGAEAATEHLVRLGHTDIAVVLIAEHPFSPFNERQGISARRMAGIRGALARANGDGETGEEDVPTGRIGLRVISTPVSEEGGRAAFATLEADGLPTAVMTMSDVTAIGLMAAAIDAGIRVPEELSIVGYDDIPAASWTAPRLTTVHQPIREKGRRAARTLIHRIRTRADGAPAVAEILATRLVVRGSTAPPRASDASPLPAMAMGGGGVAPP